MGSWVDTFFGWPSGGIWSNLLASAIWVPIAGVPTYIKIRKHHRRVEAHNAYMEEKMEKLHKKLGIK